ncbi:MAG TPA: MarR family transcriptional regulator [Bacteroidetes bacterium]|nr:MarR family transcriptional regulator [Candidatus Limimorpha avicola]
MLLIKEVAVYINILNSKIKKYFGDELNKNTINMTPEQYLVMDILWDEGTLSQQAIADIIQKDKNSVTKFIDSLERKGFVFRAVDKEDRRINNIVLSKDGIMLKDTTTEVAINMMNQVVKNIDDNELAVFVKVLQQMKHNIENAI